MAAFAHGWAGGWAGGRAGGRMQARTCACCMRAHTHTHERTHARSHSASAAHDCAQLIFAAEQPGELECAGITVLEAHHIAVVVLKLEPASAIAAGSARRACTHARTGRAKQT